MVPFEQPNKNEPFAEVSFITGHKSSFEGNFYKAFYNEGCHGKGSVLATFIYGAKEKNIKFPVDKRFYIRGTALVPNGSHINGQTLVTKSLKCYSLQSFIPEKNGKYLITQDFKSNDCQLVIKDANSNQAPKSLLSHEITSDCTQD